MEVLEAQHLDDKGRLTESVRFIASLVPKMRMPRYVEADWTRRFNKRSIVVAESDDPLSLRGNFVDIIKDAARRYLAAERDHSEASAALTARKELDDNFYSPDLSPEEVIETIGDALGEAIIYYFEELDS
jgi:hypothetical protein